MKRCAKCGDTKPVDEFSKDSGHRDGLTSYCKLCAVAASTKWVAANPERAKALMDKFFAKNPGAMASYRQNRRARKNLSNGKISAGMAQKLFKLQKGKCPCCKQELGDNFHLDHVIPLALGGSNTDDNMQLLRAKCNQQKHAKHPVDFMQERGYLL